MKCFRYGFGLGFALSLSLVQPALAQEEIRIGVIYPLTGAAASTGRRAEERAGACRRHHQQRHQGARICRLTTDGRPAQSQGRQDQAGLRRPSGQSADRRHRGRAPDHAGEGGRDRRLLHQQRDQHGQPGGGAQRHSVPQPRVVVGDADPARLQVVLPHDAARRSVRAQLLRVPEGRRDEEEHQASSASRCSTRTRCGAPRRPSWRKSSPREQKYTIVEKIIYPAKSTQLTSEVQRSRRRTRTWCMQSSYLGDAILSMKTYKELGFSPDMAARQRRRLHRHRVPQDPGQGRRIRDQPRGLGARPDRPRIR